jgi:hypothetical protein
VNIFLFAVFVFNIMSRDMSLCYVGAVVDICPGVCLNPDLPPDGSVGENLRSRSSSSSNTTHPSIKALASYSEFETDSSLFLGRTEALFSFLVIGVLIVGVLVVSALIVKISVIVVLVINIPIIV